MATSSAPLNPQKQQAQLPDVSVGLKIAVSYWRPPPLDLSVKADLSPAAASSRLSCGAPALQGYTPLAPASPALSYKVS